MVWLVRDMSHECKSVISVHNIIHKQQHSSHLLQEWPPQAHHIFPSMMSVPMKTGYHLKQALHIRFMYYVSHGTYVRHTMDPIYNCPPGSHSWLVNWMEKGSQLLCVPEKRKKVLSKYYSLFHITSETLECPVVVVFCPFDTLCSMPPSANGIWR
jgi:hypothetical protein